MNRRDELYILNLISGAMVSTGIAAIFLVVLRTPCSGA